MVKRIRGRKVTFCVLGCCLLITFVFSKLLGIFSVGDTHTRYPRPNTQSDDPNITSPLSRNVPYMNIQVFHQDTSKDIDMAASQTARHQHIKSGCNQARQRGIRFDISARPLYYNDNFNLMYCAVPKVAATSWKRVLLVLQGDAESIDGLFHMDVQHRHRYPSTRGLTDYERQLRLAMYTSFVFVREPFHRILSAYRDKFEPKTKPAFRRYATNILMKNGRRLTQDSVNSVTFSDFIRYLIDPRTTYQRMDMHWRPMFMLCNVCNINYDFIGKFEYLKEDATNVLKLVNASDVVSFPGYENGAHVTNSSSSDIYTKYYSTVSLSNLARLYKKYELDFTLFGYSVPDIIASRLQT